MSFAYPWVLVLLLAPIALLGWTWRRHGGRVAVPFDHADAPRGRFSALGLNLADSLPPLLLAVGVVLLAGPQETGEPKTRRVLTNIEFCVDVSGSMTASFGDGNRYDASMAAIDRFLDGRPDDAYGLTFFGNSVLHWTPLTSDVSALKCAPPFMDPRRIPGWFGGTEIGKALLACRKILRERQEGDRMIILVSDGWSADLYGSRSEEISDLLAADGIVVYGIHVAGGAVPDDIVTITANTGGEAFPADDPEGLAAIFARISAMSQTRLEKTAPESRDDFFPWCVAGLACTGAWAMAGFGLRGNPW